MPETDLRTIRDFPTLIRFLRTDLGWPVDEQDADDLTFDYSAAELGLDERLAVKVRQIKQLRPLAGGQPWGVFWIDFEPKRLPVVVMRRILSALVQKQRGQRTHQAAWNLRDLMFISATGQGNERGISFAHFQEDEAGKPELHTFSWDVRETHQYFIRRINLQALRWPADPADAPAWRTQWNSAFPVPHGYVPATAQALAGEMARIADDIRQAVSEIYSMEHVGGPLHQLHLSLKMTLINDLEADDFADMYAQTVTYGLFAARATHQGVFAGGDVAALIAHTNPFLRELLEQMTAGHALDLDELGVGELTNLLRRVDMEAILRDFGRQKRGEDPVIHFYETFMKQYDPQQKTRRGEFYTPDAVVSFIVRSVDTLLREKFGYADGLADTGTMDWKGRQVARVQVLDPATGTGTFHKYVIQVVWDTFYQKTKNLSAEARRARWNEYVRQNLLPRLYGFELKMAPYTIAHMKLGLALQEKGFDFQEGERLRVYLSNALQPAYEVKRVDTPALAHEVEQANRVKAEVPVSVIIGNPPYSVSSSNSGEWIVNLLEDYKKSVRREETQIQAISDDYIKFIRFAHWRIESTGKGIIGLITNNGYLRGPLFRDMREALLRSFSEIYVLNLHGSTRWKEKTPDGRDDKNVFDIQQGVSIIFLVKNENSREVADLFYADLWGSREDKYSFLLTSSIKSLDFVKVSPTSPFFFFSPLSNEVKEEYELGTKITDVFGSGNAASDLHVAYGAGFVTQQDAFAISFDATEVAAKVEYLIGAKTEEVARQMFNLCTTNQWNFEKARSNLYTGKWKDRITQVAYRPLDNRFTAYVQDVVSIPRWAIMENLLNQNGKNIAFITSRIINGEKPAHFFVTSSPTEKIFLSAKTSNNAFVFPLYLYPVKNARAKSAQLAFGGFEHQQRSTNLSPSFLNRFSALLNLVFNPDGTGDLKSTFGPEDIFHYLYAIFHSPTYRQRYAEFLKMDFPRLPLTSNVGLFRELCRLGGELVGLHLLESPAVERFRTQFVGQGDGAVAKGYPKYSQETVWINPQQGFEGVPEAVWEFHIGGYQVCEKWLKDRRGRTLSAEDVTHYQKVVVALGETIRIMGEIDGVIEGNGGWPIQ